MAYCSKCGKEIEDGAAICIHCGCYTTNNTATPKTADSKSFGYALLGFFIPIAGLILWLVWKDETPLRAKSAGKGALVSAIAYAVFLVIYFIFIAILIASIGASHSF